jgi:hypothetical protein
VDSGEIYVYLSLYLNVSIYVNSLRTFKFEVSEDLHADSGAVASLKRNTHCKSATGLPFAPTVGTFFSIVLAQSGYWLRPAASECRQA